ncbi:unnamed protein product [Pseudo-nitzschia multistriata]|uniref:PRP1 splicing factor N-terminal domain-containing protein n=1 Tax=Pseudo-nitzschia multistriata TaxID=183589 RepID=A0A448ZL49_9STRA|nr:unnamed protein product [Pseudo-nitzschia multistriata]
MFGGYNPSARGPGGSGPAQAPRGYIAGRGRGAAGFQTRSDLGNTGDTAAFGGGPTSMPASANAGSSNSPWGSAPRGYVAGAGRGASKMGAASQAFGPNGQPLDDNNTGSGGREQRATASARTSAPPSGAVEGQYDDDDHEADLIWAAIDERLQNRRKKRKKGSNEVQGPAHTDDPRARERMKIQHSFRDVKEELGTLSEEAWMNLPDAMGDHSLKHKRAQEKKQGQIFTPITDSMLESRIGATSDKSSMNLNTQVNINDKSDGTETSAVNMSGIGAARGTVLGLSLDRMSESANDSGLATSVNASGYLTSMSTLNGGAPGALPNNLGDIHKARLLLKSVRDTNPKHGPGWIASARIEEAAGKTLKARKIIQEGCETCPKFVDVWLEAARLHPLPVAKSILATGVRRVDNNVPLFLKAAELETVPAHKKAVLRKALEANPHSLQLWKQAIDLEDSQDRAKLLLSVAVEKVPTAIELWMALARLETYEEAQKTLNKARKALPLEKSIWMAASKLEESQNHLSRIPKLVDKAFKTLAKKDVVISRNQWISEAEDCEMAGAPHTSAAIVAKAIGLGVLDEDRIRTWSDDAKQVLARGHVATARAILAHALQQFPSRKGLWMQAVELEKTAGAKNVSTDFAESAANDTGEGAENSRENNENNQSKKQHVLNESLDQVLQAASERLPRVEVFWLLRAKERWLAGFVDSARDILTKAFEANPDSERVWLAAAKLEWETGETERARVLLERARERAPSERVYMKSALLEREAGDTRAALALIEEGLQKYPKTAPKLYMMGGQICSDDLPRALANSNSTDEKIKKKKKSYLDKARKIYQEGIEKCVENVTLWILASRLEERAHTFVSENGSTASESSTNQGVAKARSLLELARLKHPKNDLLWLEATRLERRSGNTKLAESLMARALQECPKSGRLLAENIATAPRVEQKSKSADAIKRNPESPLVIATVASLFASDRKITKARKWFERAVLLDPDLGDSWAKYYNFESNHGTKQQKDAIRERCIKAEPKHGETWQSVMKDTSNRHKTPGEGLELVASEIKSRAV